MIFPTKQSYRSVLLAEVESDLQQNSWKHLQEVGHGWKERGLAAENREKM